MLYKNTIQHSTLELLIRLTGDDVFEGFHEPIKMSDGVALNWENIEKRLFNIQKEPHRIFQSVP